MNVSIIIIDSVTILGIHSFGSKILRVKLYLILCTSNTERARKTDCHKVCLNSEISKYPFINGYNQLK